MMFVLQISEPSSPPKCGKFGAKSRVIYATIVVSCYLIGCGCMYSYPSPAVPNINNNPNLFQLSERQQSWVASIMSLGGFFGAFLIGVVCDHFGRKVALLGSSILCIISFTLVAAATSAHFLYAGLFASGVFNTINSSAALLFVSEISPLEFRGLTLSFNGILIVTGGLAVYVAGFLMPWNWLAIFCCLFFALPAIPLAFLPESPRWLLMKKQKEAAAYSLRWYRNSTTDIEVEIRAVEQQLVDSTNEIVLWKELLFSYKLNNLTCLLLLTTAAFSGVTQLIVYSVTVYQMAGVSLNPYVQAIITGASGMFGGLGCLVLVDRCGRKRLLLISLVALAVTMLASGAFFKVSEVDPYFARTYLGWLPVVAFSVASFFYFLGIGTVLWMLTCEMFPTSVRAKVQTVVSLECGLLFFLGAQTFFTFTSIFETSGTFWFYGVIQIVGIVYVRFFVPETSQKMMA